MARAHTPTYVQTYYIYDPSPYILSWKQKRLSELIFAIHYVIRIIRVQKLLLSRTWILIMTGKEVQHFSRYLIEHPCVHLCVCVSHLLCACDFISYDIICSKLPENIEYLAFTAEIASFILSVWCDY